MYIIGIAGYVPRGFISLEFFLSRWCQREIERPKNIYGELKII